MSLSQHATHLLTFSLLCLAVVAAFAKYSYIHDETAWTKQSWESLKLRFPLEKVLQEQDWDGHSLISSRGTYRKEDLEQVAQADPDDRLQGFLEQSLLDETALAVVANLVGCKVCQEVHTAVWHQARDLVHGSSQKPSEALLRRRLSHTCTNEAAAELLSKWAIFRVGAPAAAGAAPAALAPQEAWAYVLKARAQAERPTDFERQAMERSCAALFEEPDEDSSSSSSSDEGEAGSAEKEEEPRAGAVLARQVAEYRKAHGRLRGEAGRGQPDAEGHVEHLGRPDGKACRDYHRQCLEWADSGECELNPRYMIGEEDQDSLKGYCRLSCGTCTPKTPAGLPAELEAELEETSRELLASLLQQACVAQSVCSGLSGQAAKAMDTAMAATDAAGGQANELATNTRYLAKAQMRKVSDAVTGRPAHIGLEVEGVGLHCYYVDQGWWSYELCPGHHVRQFHAVPEQNVVESTLDLGFFDVKESTEEHRKAGASLMLGEEDLLPGMQPGSTAYVAAYYTNGAECERPTEADVAREVEVRMACSPDAEVYMLVREPELCQYVVTLYHPLHCSQWERGLHPVGAPSPVSGRNKVEHDEL